MIKIVLFDLDDTLYEEKKFVISGFKTVSKYLSKKYNIEYNKIFSVLENDFNNGLRKNNFDVLLKKLQLMDEDIEELIKIYREHNPEISLYDDANFALKKLKKISKLGLVTDGYEITQRNKISALKIAKYFNEIVINDPINNLNKKKPEVFKKIIMKLKVNPNEIVYVGDNPLKDFIVSKKMGIYTVRIKRKSGEYSKINVDESNNADFIISNLYELLHVINNIK